MIHYNLRCKYNHHFDEWFNNSNTYETKLSAGEITCPICKNKEVPKGIIAPNVSTSSQEAKFSVSHLWAKNLGDRCTNGLCNL